ncbi:hypothetical protein E1211_10440 [Micromonospora sp. 15K316]|uniref:hypothetical protein n=1 Tax=Micromonospora sp. 15K316 TaxID=2530376 RepID=UPI0010494639|nr:hypothetical protein [Micromonospora sp. 15K316]TDC37393.1 hypothetical protein E1211_10440 [Micromonospora sp. 15K316]
MPPPRPRRPAERRKVSWEAVAGVTAVVGLVATIVFSVLQLTTADSPEAAPPPDERLELVEAEFAGESTAVTVLEEVPPDGRPSVSPYPEVSAAADAASRPALHLLVTLRNPTEETAVLTGVKLVVHEALQAPVCGRPSGGIVRASVNYSFRFPTDLAGSWSRTNPQNFAVAPRDVDALSVTMGPELSANVLTVWRFSVYGVSKGGREALWAHGVATEFATTDEEPYTGYIWPQPRERGEQDRIRTCAADAEQRLRRLAEAAGPDAVTHPGFTALLGAYRTLAAR